MISNDWTPGDMMNDSDGLGMMNGGWLMMAVLLLVVFLLLGLVTYLAIKTTKTSARDSDSADAHAAESAREVLDLRLARGEISEDEYTSSRALLGS